MSLKVYQQKRNFRKTPEPAGGKIKKSTKHLLFIIQKHAASHLHYDFRLELDGVLLSWAVPKGPSLDPKVKRLAMHVEDHPLEYGSFEGIIPKGQYGGGTVMLWDKGEWVPEDEHPYQAYKKGDLTFTLNADKLHGKWKLIRLRTDVKSWLLFKIQDKYAKTQETFDITKKKPNSVVTKRSLDEIADDANEVWNSNKASKEKLAKPKKSRSKKAAAVKKNVKNILQELTVSKMPTVIRPQLATLVDKPPAGSDWLHEIKLDGYRIIAFKSGAKTQLITRNNNNWTNKYPRVAAEINKLEINKVILDGEIVVLDANQHSNFQLLQNSMKSGKETEFIYYIFDLLYYDRYDLLELPLIERKNLLQAIIPEDSSILKYNDHIVGSGPEILKKTCELALEGIVSKQANSPYIQKRSKCWLKTKCVKRQEFIIAGFTPPSGKRSFFGSLLLGTYNKKKQLIYHGNVGTGFTEASLKSLYQLMQKNKIKQMPFQQRPPASKNVTWLKPILVAEVEFLELTEEGYVRHSSFKGLRTDKNPKDIKIEKEKSIEKLKK